MAAAPAPLVFGFAPDATAAERIPYTVGLLLIELSGLALMWGLRSDGVIPQRLLAGLAAVDIVGLALMELVSTPEVPDPLYPVFLIMPVLYALLVPRRRALVIGALAGAAYAAASVSLQLWHYYDVLVYVERVVCLPLVTWIVAVAVDLQRRQVERLQVVSGISEAVHTSLDAEFLTCENVEVLADALGVRSWRLVVVEREGREILFEAASTATGASISTRVPEWRGEVHAFAPLGRIEPDPAIEILPVLVQEHAEVLFCAGAHEVRGLTQEDRIVLQGVARELLVAVDNRRLYGITKRLSITDSLTGLYNRRFLAGRIAEEIGRARRYEKPVSLLMLDGDDFKHVNDAHGHRAGDDVLVELAELMRVSVRDVDVVARYGGEEFCVLLPETDGVGARQVAEKLCRNVAAHVFEPGVTFTVSVGLATFPTDAETAEDLQQIADSALYEAKSRGKNRVCAPAARTRAS